MLFKMYCGECGKNKKRLIGVGIFLVIWTILNIFFSIALYEGIFDAMDVDEVEMDVEFIFDNMTDEQISDAVTLFMEVKNEYLYYIKEVKFTSNKSYCDGCAGRSYGTRILIEWTDKDYINREVLCHELLHDYIPSPIDEKLEKEHPVHQVVYQLAQEGVCFK